MDFLDRAIEVALKAHDGQTDKIGRPYFEHCQRVALLVPGDQARTVAYLHDVVEKGRGWSLSKLDEAGFPPEVVSAVDALTKRPDEETAAFVRRAAMNRLAVPVKQADLEDNLWQAERSGSDPAKYRYEMEILRASTGRQF
ncbi:HD domain-containing protein [Rhizobium sp. OAE497]|uniref:HD domain-containing protein n=1 Tax=Rhizobium sp. OAE497 TaxID=2663796 RepID=UPI0018F7C22A